ncbi:MAG: radical SAM protein [Pseudomonadota bacterium]
MSPAAVPRHALRIEGTRGLLYDRAAHQYHALDAAECFALVENRHRPLHQVLPVLARACGPERTALAATRVGELTAIDPASTLDADLVELEPLDGAAAAPLVLHLGLTQACNFSCSHCYSSSGRRANDELSLPELLALVDELAHIGCLKLVLGGGEPFLRPELVEVVGHARQRGIDCFVHTNGSRLQVEILSRLAEVQPAGLAVSLDGPDAITNDSMRGAGSFDRTLRGLQLLRRHYAPGFAISFTVTPLNRSRVGEMVALAHHEGARVLLLRPAYPAGEALRDGNALSCDRASFVLAVEQARAAAAGSDLILDAPHPDERTAPDFEGFGCVAGRIVAGVTPSGVVTPCLNLPAGHAAGTLREHSLLQLWREGASFKALRALQAPDECAHCDRLEICRGGCRVRALDAHGCIGAADSWCDRLPARPGAGVSASVRDSGVLNSVEVSTF